jgi:hypothetical protein
MLVTAAPGERDHEGQHGDIVFLTTIVNPVASLIDVKRIAREGRPGGRQLGPPAVPELVGYGVWGWVGPHRTKTLNLLAVQVHPGRMRSPALPGPRVSTAGAAW